ncbi:MAG: hypothetical protein HC783_06260, partial [Rhodobacteraceae bacterium]|nr:hypothetical protein [Paracoccaceae bacterium]
MTAAQHLLIGALDALQHCTSDADRWACGTRLLQDCGSDWVTAGTAARTTGAALAIRTNTPAALMRDYMDQRLYLSDPWMEFCARSTAPNHLDVAAELQTPTRRRQNADGPALCRSRGAARGAVAQLRRRAQWRDRDLRPQRRC